MPYDNGLPADAKQKAAKTYNAGAVSKCSAAAL